jgi:hypothetical protein
LLSVLPDSLDGHCAAVPATDYVTSTVTDEVICDSSDVVGAAAYAIGYSRFKTSEAVIQYFDGILSSNGLSAGTGDCLEEDLSGTPSAGGDYCEGSYEDDDGNTGWEVLYVGPGFDVGGSEGSSAAFCAKEAPGSSGTSMVIWTSPSDDSSGFAFDCSASTGTYIEDMQSNLIEGNYVLND